MKLNYSLGNIEPHWFVGDLPFPGVGTKPVRAKLSPWHLPPIAEAKLLIFFRDSPKEVAVTLMMTYHYEPSRASSPQVKAEATPSSPISGEIRIALPPEAVSQIRRVNGDEYELILEDIELINVTSAAGT